MLVVGMQRGACARKVVLRRTGRRGRHFYSLTSLRTAWKKDEERKRTRRGKNKKRRRRGGGKNSGCTEGRG